MGVYIYDAAKEVAMSIVPEVRMCLSQPSDEPLAHDSSTTVKAFALTRGRVAKQQCRVDTVELAARHPVCSLHGDRPFDQRSRC